MSEGVIDLASWMMGGITGEGDAVPPYSPGTYPLDLPSVSGIRDTQWFRDEVRGISESPFTLHRQTHLHAGERWRVAIILPKMTREQAAEWATFLLRLEGGYGTFLFGDVFNPLPRGVWSDAPAVDGAGQTGKLLNVKGLNVNVANIGKAGDFFSLNNRLYMVTRNFSSDTEGKAIIDIWPRLRESPADETLLQTANARGTFQLATPGGGLYSVGIDGIFSVPAFQIIEAI